MTIAWPDNREDQIAMIRQLYSDISDLERKYIPATLFDNATPTQDQIRDSWDVAYDSSPLLYSKVASYKTDENLVDNIHISMPSFVRSWPVPTKNWNLLSSYLKDYDSASADLVWTVPITYQKIALVMTIRTEDAASAPGLAMRVNGLSSANYFHQRSGVYNDGDGTGGFSNASEKAATFWTLDWVAGALNDTPLSAQVYMEFPFYTTASFIEFYGRSIISYGDKAAGDVKGILAANWWGFMNATSQVPMTSITILDSDGFAPGTKIDMYGVLPL